MDIEAEPSQPNAPKKGSRPRRRLSDVETEDGPVQPQEQTKPQFRPTLAGTTTDSGAPRFEAPPQSESPRPRLADVTAAPEGQEPRPRAGRPRLAAAVSCEALPGLQAVGDSSSSAPSQAGPEHPTGKLRPEPNLSLALVAGLIAALVGAAAWALLAMATGYYIGWMAVGVGLLVGGAVRLLGRGTDRSFGCLSLAMVVFGCLLGNLLSICMIVAGQEGLSALAVLSHLCSKPAVIPAVMIATFHALDPLFYGIALYAGYRLSFRRVVDAR